MTYSTTAYTGRALDKVFPRYEERWLKQKKQKLAPKPTLAVKRDWLLVGSDRRSRDLIKISSIQSAVCEHFAVSHFDLCSERKTNVLVRPRHVSYWLCHHLTRRSYPFIGLQHGGRDHTTIMYGVKKITRDMQSDAVFASELNALRNEIEVAHHGKVD